MDAIDPRISSRLRIAGNFATPGQVPVSPDLPVFPSLNDTAALGDLPVFVLNETDLNAFMEKMRSLKQDALRQRALRGGSGTRPAGDKERDRQGPLDVKAHGYYEGDKLVPVREIRVFEIGNYRKRAYNTFAGGWPDNSLRMDNARVGKHYRVKVTWESGATQERDVTMDSASGTSVDVWRY